MAYMNHTLQTSYSLFKYHTKTLPGEYQFTAHESHLQSWQKEPPLIKRTDCQCLTVNNIPRLSKIANTVLLNLFS